MFLEFVHRVSRICAPAGAWFLAGAWILATNNREIKDYDSDNGEDDYLEKDEIKREHIQDSDEDDIKYNDVYVKNNNIPFEKGKRKYIDVFKSPIEFLYEKQFESKKLIKYRILVPWI